MPNRKILTSCVECGADVEIWWSNISRGGVRCRLCKDKLRDTRNEQRAYLPTPAQIAAEKLKIREERTEMERDA